MKFKLVEDWDRLTEDRAARKFIYEAIFYVAGNKEEIEIFSDDFNLFLSFIDKFIEHNSNLVRIAVYILRMRKNKNKIDFPDVKEPFSISTKSSDVIGSIKNAIENKYKKSKDSNSIELNGKSTRLIDIWLLNHETDGTKYNIDSDYVGIIQK